MLCLKCTADTSVKCEVPQTEIKSSDEMSEDRNGKESNVKLCLCVFILLTVIKKHRLILDCFLLTREECDSKIKRSNS